MPPEKTLIEAQKSLELALSSLLRCHDARGLKVMLGGDFARTKSDFERISDWLTGPRPVVFMDGEAGRAAALHNLAKLAEAYASYLDYQELGGQLGIPHAL